jgi:hypothetical protein
VAYDWITRDQNSKRQFRVFAGTVRAINEIM